MSKTAAAKKNDTVILTYLTGTGVKTAAAKVTEAHADGSVDVEAARPEGKAIRIQRVPPQTEGCSPPCYRMAETAKESAPAGK